jgi:predicted glycogen debranching enzyme
MPTLQVESELMPATEGTPYMIAFDSRICQDLNEAQGREWLETNGLGGFASSTIAGMNTRRYHGLLIAATAPPAGRMVLLSKLEETLVIDDQRFELAVNQYPGVVHPQGHRFLISFRLDPFPVFAYEIAGVHLQKTVFMVHGENTIIVRYRCAAGEGHKLKLELHPLIAFRDYHNTTHENGALDRHIGVESGVVSVAPYAALPTLYIAHTGASVGESGDWYRNFEYERERERGLDYREDLFNPFVFAFDLSHAAECSVIASTERRDASLAESYEVAERERRAAIVSHVDPNDKVTRELRLAADQFIVRRGAQKTVIAGYHWFADWGRDTMIALPGLTLATGRYDDARSILLEFTKHVDRGMLPNRFPDANEQPEYNTVDATLWYFEAIRQYVEHTGDRATVVSQLYPVLTDIMQWHFRGTRHGIRVEDDGLLQCGEPGVQLTWMDAKIGDWVVTPRYGKPVEIQALWHNALAFMADVASWVGNPAESERWATLAARARASFDEKFWNPQLQCLYDVVNGEQNDSSIRPNQIFVVSLPHPMLSAEKCKAVVETVHRELLTPFGLRTLARTDAQYHPTYGGDAFSRDSAYHQGTVWPWLIGAFLTAYVKVFGDPAIPKAKSWLTCLEQHLSAGGLGQVSEVFDADPPYRAGGCIAQAWSVAELLRVHKELERAAVATHPEERESDSLQVENAVRSVRAN